MLLFLSCRVRVLGRPAQLEVAKRSATTAKLEIRRELTKKMQLKLDETESMWKAKNETLLSELERLAASNREMLKMHAEGSLGEAATAMQVRPESSVRIRHDAPCGSPCAGSFA